MYAARVAATAWSHGSDKLSFGSNGYWSNDTGTFTGRRTAWGIDSQLTLGGFDLNAEYLHSLQNRLTGADTTADGWSALAGYFLVPKTLQGVVRYETYNGNTNIGGNTSSALGHRCQLLPQGRRLEVQPQLHARRSGGTTEPRRAFPQPPAGHLLTHLCLPSPPSASGSQLVNVNQKIWLGFGSVLALVGIGSSLSYPQLPHGRAGQHLARARSARHLQGSHRCRKPRWPRPASSNNVSSTAATKPKSPASMPPSVGSARRDSDRKIHLADFRRDGSAEAINAKAETYAATFQQVHRALRPTRAQARPRPGGRAPRSRRTKSRLTRRIWATTNSPSPC